MSEVSKHSRLEYSDLSPTIPWYWLVVYKNSLCWLLFPVYLLWAPIHLSQLSVRKQSSLAPAKFILLHFWAHPSTEFGPTNLVLQFIFNCSCSYQSQVGFYQIRCCFHMIFSVIDGCCSFLVNWPPFLKHQLINEVKSAVVNRKLDCYAYLIKLVRNFRYSNA